MTWATSSTSFCPVTTWKLWERGAAVAHGGYLVPLAREPANEEVAVAGIVVHHQDVAAGTRRRGRAPWRRGRSRIAGAGLGGGLPAQHLVHEPQQAERRLPDPLEVRNRVLAPALLGLLLEQLAVAHDLPDRRAQGVAQPAHGVARFAGEGFLVAHGGL